MNPSHLPSQSLTGRHEKLKPSTANSVDGSSCLPLEVWRVVFCYLELKEICRCAQVCREWRQLVCSLDKTVWKKHFLKSSEWRHPLWPREEDEVVHRPWRHLYREHKMATRAWAGTMYLPDSASCMHLMKRKQERKTICVGPLAEHETLKSALSVARDYDRILIAPGLYDEQFEMSSKIPFELVGRGTLGTVTLVMSIEQNAITGRLCNLVLKAPWFTSHVIKVKQGHLQVDNCVLQDGQVVIQAPATCCFRYCKFQKAQMSLHHVSISIIENCLFSDYQGPAMCIEGYPSEELNWAHQHLHQMSDTWGIRNFGKELEEGSERDCCKSTISFLQSNSDIRSLSNYSFRTEMDDIVSVYADLASQPPKPDDVDSIGIASIANSPTSSSSSSFDSYSLDSKSTDSRLNYKTRQWNIAQTTEALAAAAKSDTSSSAASSGCSSPTADSTSLHLGDNHAFLSCLWNSNDQSAIERNLQTDFYSSLHSDVSLQEMVEGTLGCIIRKCKVISCQGGVMVSLQGQGKVEENEFRDVQYGIRCLQNSKVAILGNSIHHCSTSGVFMRLAAHGLIAGNDIFCTNEAGIDIRKNADPLIQCNRIHHCKRSGIVVLGSSSSTIKSNDIYQNKEAGIYILYKANPYVSGNRIVHGGAAGIAINEEGRGYIAENVISANRWGGIDIRRGSNPHVTHNYICNGLADGIVIGQRGQGTIEANTIKGNMGCGVWVMGGQPLIQLNQIYNNNDTGVSFIQSHQNNEDMSTDGDESDSATSELSLAFLTHLEEQGSEDRTNEESSQELHPKLSYNTIYHNNGCGVIVQCSEPIVMYGNAIHSNCSTGVFIKQSLPVSILSNSITFNTGVGLHIAVEAQVRAEGNGIYDNSSHGVLVQGEVSMISNDIFSNKGHALLCDQCTKCQVEENRIHAPHELAIQVKAPVKACVKNNTFYRGETRLWPDELCPDEDILENTILEHTDQNDGEKGAGKNDWHLENPPARPHIETPPSVVLRSPTQHVTKVTRVMMPAGVSCQQTSTVCIIL